MIVHYFQGVGATSCTFVALKALGMKPAQFFVKHCDIFDEVCLQKLPIGDREFGNLDVFFNSVTHLETTKQRLEKIFMAVFLYQCFEHTGYFKNLQDEGMYLFINFLYTVYNDFAPLIY